jgi:hypothetical protein
MCIGEKMRKLVVVLVLMMVGAAIAAPDVFADQPTITPSPSSDFVDTTCGFPITIHYGLVNGETTKTFTSGTTIITGPLFAELSGPTGKSITVNESGPAKLTVSDRSVLFVGHGVGIGPLVTANRLVFAYVAGVVSISTSPLEGVLERGTVLLNFCDALAR